MENVVDAFSRQQVVAVTPVFPRQRVGPAGQVPEVEKFAAIAAEGKRCGPLYALTFWSWLKLASPAHRRVARTQPGGYRRHPDPRQPTRAGLVRAAWLARGRRGPRHARLAQRRWLLTRCDRPDSGLGPCRPGAAAALLRKRALYPRAPGAFPDTPAYDRLGTRPALGGRFGRARAGFGSARSTGAGDRI